MKVIWSPLAIDAVRERFGDADIRWRLVHDTEGCGCVVSGVPALWAVDGPEEGDEAADGEPYRLWFEKRHEVFFEDRLRIGYNAATRSFGLSSDNQIYTSAMRLTDRRSAATQAQPTKGVLA